MNYDRKFNTIKNLCWGIINKILMIFFPFIIRTIIIRKLGNEYLGLNSLFTSILQVLSLSELGFSSAVVFSLYAPIAHNDSKKVCEILMFYKQVYKLIGLIILVGGIMCIPILPVLIKDNSSIPINIYPAFFVFLINTVLSYLLFGYKNALLEATQRNDIQSNIASITNTVMYLTQIVLLLLMKDYYIYIVAFPLFTIIGNVVTSKTVDSLYPEFKANGELDKKEKNKIWKKIKSLVIYKIGNIVSNSADNIVMSAFLGLSIVGMYNNYYYIISSLFGLLTIYYNAMKAGIGNSIVVESIEKNYQTFNTLYFMQAWLISFCSICLLVLYQPFMRIWVGEEGLLPFCIVILFVIYFYTWKIHDIVHTFKEAIGLWDQDKFRPLLSSILNLFLNIVLVKKVGLIGIILSTIISEVVVTLPWAPKVLFKFYFKKSSKDYYLKLVIYTFTAILVSVITYLLSELFPFGGQIVQFGYKLIICVVIPNLMFFLIYRKTEEYNNIKRWILTLSKNI